MKIGFSFYIYKIVRLALILLALLVFFKVAMMGSIATNNNFPNQSREAAEVIATHDINAGESPSSLTTYPKNSNGYVLFNHFFSSLFISADNDYMNTVTFMRSSYWISSFLATILLIAVCRRENVPLSLACLCAAIYLIHLTCLRNEMGSKPGGLGNVIFLVGMIIPYMSRFSLPSMIVGIFFLVLATFTKKLFLVGFPALLTYYFVYYNRGRALVLSVFALLLLFASLAVYELCLPNTMGIFDNSHFSFRGGRWEMMFAEKIQFALQSFWPIAYLSFAVVFVYVTMRVVAAYEAYTKSNNDNEIDITIEHQDEELFDKVKRCWSSPLQKRMPYSLFLALTIMIIYYGYLVKDTYIGHFYYNNLFLFFALWAFVAVGARLASKGFDSMPTQFRSFMKCSVVSIIYASLLTTLYLSYSMYASTNGKVRSDFSNDWEDLRRTLDPYEKVLAFRLITPILLEQKKEFYDSGHLPYSIDVATFRNRSFLKSKIDDYKQNIINRVYEGYFDALFLNYSDNAYSIDGVSFSKEELLMAGYMPTYTKRLNATFDGYDIQGWEKIR